MFMSDKKKLFGEFDNLKNGSKWTTAFSSMFEWITWETDRILGIPKSEYAKKVIALTVENLNSNSDQGEIAKKITNTLSSERKKTYREDRFAEKMKGLVNPYEALRRARFFSEDYINKEFDLFMYLASSSFLDYVYSKYFQIKAGECWYYQGNSGMFAVNTNTGYMQMDGLSYNEKAKVIIGNELKLGGKKNKDQILKYVSLYIDLKESNFIEKDCSFKLLFTSETEESFSIDALLEDEIKHCSRENKEWFKRNKAKIMLELPKIEVNSMSWIALRNHIKEYLPKVNSDVEEKLMNGFIDAIEEKYHINKLL